MVYYCQDDPLCLTETLLSCQNYLFRTMEDLVKRAETSQRIIRSSVIQFVIETTDTDHGGSKYAKTLEELNKFKDVVDSFGEEFVTNYESAIKKHVFLLEELPKLKVKLVELFEKRWEIVTRRYNGVYKFFVAPLIVMSMLIEINALKKQIKMLEVLESKANTNSEAMKNIKCRIDELTSSIEPILDDVKVALGDEENEFATELVIKSIMTKEDDLTEKIKKVNESVALHRELIDKGRGEVHQHLRQMQKSPF